MSVCVLGGLGTSWPVATRCRQAIVRRPSLHTWRLEAPEGSGEAPAGSRRPGQGERMQTRHGGPCAPWHPCPHPACLTCPQPETALEGVTFSNFF